MVWGRLVLEGPPLSRVRVTSPPAGAGGEWGAGVGGGWFVLFEDEEHSTGCGWFLKTPLCHACA